MRKLLLAFLLGICCMNAQVTTPTVQYYLEIPVSTNVPKIKSTMINGKTALSLEFKNKSITDLFKKFKISDFKLAFPGGKGKLLESAYIIECDPKLMEMIANRYPDVFGRFEVIEPIQPLYIPNDIGGTSGSPSMAQPELNFINAPQAWDISKGDNIFIGIAEGVNVAHEDLVGKSVNIQGGNPSSTSMDHGTEVALVAGASTDNNKGMASIGFNSNIKASSYSYSGLIPLANSGARVINMSWGTNIQGYYSSPLHQEVINQVYNSGVVLVAAAGNSYYSGNASPSDNYYPASFNHVISVTIVGHQYDIGTPGIDQKYWKDVFLTAVPPFDATYNANVDLSAPGRNILTGANYVNGVTMYKYDQGTSLSAPMVTGTIGLMFGANNCLFPDEIESILKLTAVKNDLLPQNILYKGLIGAGRLDAYEAVKMAKDMSLPFGTVNVKDRIIDRWDFNLRTAPYAIKMSTNLVSNTATVNFTSRNNIEILSGDYAPATGYVDLKIVSTNTVCNIPTNISTAKTASTKTIKESKEALNKIQIYPNPNKGDFTINLGVIPESDIAISIYDLTGVLVFSTLVNSSIFEINQPKLSAGIYFVKLQGENYEETIKFIKK